MCMYHHHHTFHVVNPHNALHRCIHGTLGMMYTYVKGKDLRLVPRRLNQDNCESTFAQLRQLAGDNINMTIEEVDIGFKEIRMNGLMNIIRT